jgi:hypothetical protein
VLIDGHVLELLAHRSDPNQWMAII